MTLVRGGAAAAGPGRGRGLVPLALLRRTAPPRRGAGRGAAADSCPATFDVAYSYGNLSNVFGQSATVAASSAGGRAARPAAGRSGAAAARPGRRSRHFSSLVVVRRAGARRWSIAATRSSEPGPRAALGGWASAWSWPRPTTRISPASSWRSCRGCSRAAARAAASPRSVRGTPRARRRWPRLGQWGLPAIVLAWFGRPVAPRDGHPLDRDLAASGWPGAGSWPCPRSSRRWRCATCTRLTPPVALAAGARGGPRSRRRDGPARGRPRARRWPSALGAPAIAEALVAPLPALSARLTNVSPAVAFCGTDGLARWWYIPAAMADPSPAKSRRPHDPQGPPDLDLRRRRAAPVARPLLRLDRVRARAGQGEQGGSSSSRRSSTLYYIEKDLAQRGAGAGPWRRRRRWATERLLDGRPEVIAPALEDAGPGPATSSRRCTSRARPRRGAATGRRARRRRRRRRRATSCAALEPAQRRAPRRTRCPGWTPTGKVVGRAPLPLRLPTSSTAAWSASTSSTTSRTPTRPSSSA